MNDIRLFNKWENREILIVNGIIFPNGQIDIFTIEESSKGKYAQHTDRKNIQELYDENEVYFSSVIINHQILTPDKQFEIFCGEGSSGGDGFIIVTSIEGNGYEWIAFFEDSNPFIKVEFENDRVYGINTLNERWSFNMQNPTDINIEVMR